MPGAPRRIPAPPCPRTAQVEKFLPFSPKSHVYFFHPSRINTLFLLSGDLRGSRRLKLPPEQLFLPLSQLRRNLG